jgi:hypothetical protein
MLLGCCVVPAAAQPSTGEAAPFDSEWLIIGGAGNDVRPMTDRQVAFQAIEWGRNLTIERGPGILRGRLEMVIEVIPFFVALQSHQGEGVGFSPLMFRWNLRQHRAIHPFVEAAAGMMATNHDVPENTARLNFSLHAGGGARVRVAERWAVVVGYRLHHLSNNNTASRNPGVTSHVGYVGVAYMQ